jgi:predicted porin
MTSSKKLIAALAVSLPLVAAAQTAPAAAPAAPAKPLFNIYGTLNVNLQFSEAFGSSTGAANNVHGRFGVSTDSSNIGVRGTADVAHGLGVTYQCETSAAIDGVGAAGICGRNSRIGLSSPYGTLFYGNWDTPYKAAWYGTKADDPFGNTDVFDAAGIMGSPGARTKSSAGQTAATPSTNEGVGTTFNVRAANSVGYHSPKVAGASLRAQYSTNEFSNPTNVVTPELYSVGVNYDMGPLSLLAAVERHVDWNSLVSVAGSSSGNTKDDGVRFGAGYELGTAFGTTTIAANGEWLRFKDERTLGAGALTEISRWAWFAGLKHRVGDHEFRARFSMANDVECKIEGGTCDAPDTGAQQYALGYAYYLSKAAQIYGFWTQIDNDANAEYVFGTAGIAQITPGTGAAATNLTVPGAGANPWAAGLGMRYAF